MLEFIDVKKEIGSKVILENLNFKIPDNASKKIGLVGNNGAGKTTLLKLVAGLDDDYTGTINTSKNLRIGYLEQEINVNDTELSIQDFILKHSGIKELEEKMISLQDKLMDPNALDEYSELYETFVALDGYNVEFNIQKLLAGFDLRKDSNLVHMNELSGGEKKKVLLSTALIKGGDIVLLDEPTNDLDLNAIEFLEEYIKGNKFNMVIVSHDRRFLDDITNQIWEIDANNKNITEYTGNYSEFIESKRKDREKQQQRYNEAQEQIQTIKESIQKRSQWAMSSNSQSRSDNDKVARGYERNRSKCVASGNKVSERKLNELSEVEAPRTRKPFKIGFNMSKNSVNNYLISLNDCVLGYEDGFQMGPIDLQIKFGDRIGILGQNGVGKSTLLNAICSNGENVISGELTNKAKFINLIQEHGKIQNDTRTLLEFAFENANHNKQEAIRQIISAQISREEIDKRMCEISPGERIKLLLSSYSGKEVDAIILDEPTNHLDLEGIEILEETINQFKGTVIVVSHDREFLENIEDLEKYEIKDGLLKRSEEKQRKDAYMEIDER